MELVGARLGEENFKGSGKDHKRCVGIIRLVSAIWTIS